MSVIPHTELKLQKGTIFSTGNIKWLVSTVPKQQLLLSKAFSAIRNQSSTDFMECLSDVDIWNENVKKELQSSVTDELLSKKIVDLSTEEDYNFIMCTDNIQTPPTAAASCLQESNSLEFHYTEANQYNHYSLLHIAVDYQSTDIVDCLLQRKAFVSFKFQIHFMIITIYSFIIYLIT